MEAFFLTRLYRLDAAIAVDQRTQGGVELGGVLLAVGPDRLHQRPDVMPLGVAVPEHGIFTGNHAGSGGAIYNLYYGTAIVSRSTFSSNSAGFGGGIYNEGNVTLTVSDSTFTGNRASISGGGIRNYYSGTVTVSNSTFSGNEAYQGGGIYTRFPYGTLTVSNSTFSGNSTGIWNDYISPATLMNTIVVNSQTGANCFGTFTGGGGNLSYPDATCPGSNADPKLGPLQDNGGPTWTMALGPLSAAIDAGDDAICAAAPVNNLDQRGFIRPIGPHCDIGALEQEPYLGTWFPIVLRRQ
jgi:predicted outer membrane repeat protein